MGDKVAFIGLGVMGYPMAGHLQRAGHEVTVFNRSPARAARWVDTYGGQAAPTPGEAAQGASAVFVCVGADDDVREVTRGARGALHTMAPGAVLVDHTTTSAAVARELHAFALERELGFIDAPVSGGQSGAENGVLTVMAGGDEAAWDKVEGLVRCYARQARLLGPSGAGQLTKMMNQICVAAVVQGLAEAIHFGQRAGLDLPAVFDVITKGAAGSWQMEHRWETMAKGEFEFGFAVDLMRKDLGICLAEADRVGAELPVTALLDDYYADVQAMGGRRWDTSSLIARLGRDDED